ncbi:MAG TPA: hypothetical protein VE954_02470 [Oligoflexus sp.]|uniref:hypothetical protein n=1 Tax=Oligoflexus sp. TaxID=1971216 RepID=UPI002D63E1C4|nr:hypothetical protein [Oligoflexus sp.]HYX31951.1 hypothetical protein [Oligoflexus sp.]
MLRMTHALLCTSLVLGIVGCRASFQDIQKQGLLSSGDDLGAKGDDSVKANPDYPTLENTKELPPEDSESYGCNGTVVIREKGKDKNLDGILQPTEVTEIKTECRPKTPTTPGGKDPTTPGGKDPTTPPSQCPNQSKDPNGKCPNYPDDPDQNDPDQNDPSQSGKK